MLCLFLFAGYCFLLFQDEMSVQALIEACIVDDDKLYWCVSSPTMKDKPVSINRCTFIRFSLKKVPKLHFTDCLISTKAFSNCFTNHNVKLWNRNGDSKISIDRIGPSTVLNLDIFDFSSEVYWNVFLWIVQTKDRRIQCHIVLKLYHLRIIMWYL